MQISIVIPTYNRMSDVDKCIDSIIIQTVLPKPKEVIIVDDSDNNEIENLIENRKEKFKEMGGSPEEFIRRLLEDYHFSMFIVGHDYSMHDYASVSNKEYLKINSVDELMNFCKGERDHVNLFLEKGDSVFEKLFL